MNKKHGLGKGLGALIPEDLEETPIIVGTNKISIDLIQPNKEQPRKSFDEEKIVQLAQSIKEYGIIQPIVLKKEEEKFKIVAGERRYRAAKLAGLIEIPAVVLEVDNRRVLEISLIENIQRQDLNPIEEAIAYKKLIDEFEITQEELSTKIGNSRSTVTNRLRLLNLDKRVQEYLIDGVVSEGHCRPLLAITDYELQYKIVQMIIDERFSVRETENYIKSRLSETIKKQEKSKDKINVFYQDIKYKLEDVFGTKVNLTNKKNKGRIEIEYYSEEDLQRILEIIQIK